MSVNDVSFKRPPRNSGTLRPSLKFWPTLSMFWLIFGIQRKVLRTLRPFQCILAFVNHISVATVHCSSAFSRCAILPVTPRNEGLCYFRDLASHVRPNDKGRGDISFIVFSQQCKVILNVDKWSTSEETSLKFGYFKALIRILTDFDNVLV